MLHLLMNVYRTPCVTNERTAPVMRTRQNDTRCVVRSCLVLYYGVLLNSYQSTQVNSICCIYTPEAERYDLLTHVTHVYFSLNTCMFTYQKNNETNPAPCPCVLLDVRPPPRTIYRTVSMALMDNENITWTVERERGMSLDLSRERGMSFDLAALCDLEARQDASMLPDMKKDIKLEHHFQDESTLNDFPFGHPSHPIIHQHHFRQPSGSGSGHLSPSSPDARSTAPAKRLNHPEPLDAHDAPPTAKRLRGDSEVVGSGPREELDLEPCENAGPSPLAGMQAAMRTQTRSRSVAQRPSATAAPRRRSPSPTQVAITGSGPSKNRSDSGSGSAGRRNKSNGQRGKNVDTAALMASLGLVDARNRADGRRGGHGKGPASPPHRVGAYTLEERAVIVAKFHAKRDRRIWRKKIKYDCRKKLADKRPRLKGRFVTQEELDGLDAETLAKVTGLGSASDVESSSEDAEDSDGSEGCEATPVRKKSNASPTSGGDPTVDWACTPSVDREAGTGDGGDPSPRSNGKKSVSPKRSARGVVKGAKGGVGGAGSGGNSSGSSKQGGVTKGTGGGARRSHKKMVKPSASTVMPGQQPSESWEGALIDAGMGDKRSGTASIGGISEAAFDVMDVFANVETAEPERAEGDDGFQVKVEAELEIGAGVRGDVGFDPGSDNLVAGFMVDDILSSNFDFVGPGVAVN